MDATVRSFGGVPARMAAPELYESLSRGTVDGMLFPYASLISYDLPGITKYGTTGENFGSAVLTYVISEKLWKTFSPRSEEHTSELQSLMRISYAVFCLKKKKQSPQTNVYHTKKKNH